MGTNRNGERRGAAVAAMWVVAVISLPLGPAQAAPIEPTSKWFVDYADEKCRLARTFGEGEQRVFLFIEQAAPGRTFGLTVAGPPFRGFSDNRTVLLKFDTTAKGNRTRPFTGDLSNAGPALIFSSIDFGPEKPAEELTEDASGFAGLPAIDVEEASRANQFEFNQGRRVVTLASGPMGSPIKALNTCSADLVRSWGLDLERHRDARRLPEWTNGDKVVKQIVSQYPAKALWAGEQGVLRMRVMLNEAGAVTDCHLERATKLESLNSPACKEMQRATFAPALDRDGKAMPSYYATTIVYRVNPLP